MNLEKIKLEYFQICQICESVSGAQFVYENDFSDKQNVDSLLNNECAKRPPEIRQRLIQEFKGLGPLEVLMNDPDVSEILVNSPDSVWYEKSGKLFRNLDHFFSPSSYQNILDRLAHLSHQQLTLEKPFVEGHIDKIRISMIGNALTGNHFLLSLRKHPASPWNLERLTQANWCNFEDSQILKDLVKSKKNTLIIGETGSGKTSILNALLQTSGAHERSIIIEDSSEIYVPNDVSIKLLTRTSSGEYLKEIDQQSLLKRALRLRPDRLIMGEIRGTEAKDYLMMLATGHQGSFATLHAKSPAEALLRLEMLIQMGAPQWSLSAIRRLIFLGLQNIIVTQKSESGERILKGIYQLSSLEDSGITLESLDRFTRSTTSSEIV